MSGLAAVLAGHRPPGIYRWHAAFDAADVQHTVEGADWAFAYLHTVDQAEPEDGREAGDEAKAEFLAAIGAALGFPDYYGRNFDALADCLDDVGSGPGSGIGSSTGGTVLLWDGWGALARRDARAFSIALAVLAGRVDSERGDPFCVVLRGDGPEQPDLESLD